MKWESAVFETSIGLVNQLQASDIPEIAFSGRSNVGKSSLINKLLKRKSLARVSSTPGKTATINYYRLDNMRFVDLPGYGYASVSNSERMHWSELIESYFHQDNDLRLVIQLVDMRHPPTKDDIMMIDYMTDSEIPFIIVLTKADKLNKSQRELRQKSLKEELSNYAGIKLIPYSAVTGEGADEIRKICDHVIEDT